MVRTVNNNAQQQKKITELEDPDFEQANTWCGRVKHACRHQTILITYDSCVTAQKRTNKKNQLK